jgi:glucose-1-phosphate cytidylyltransferase
MKVVLFCGGQGLRLRDYSEDIPKPMIPLGYRPILWHVMKYYAHFGHKDFILCLGYRADYIKRYFLNYDECLSNDFVLSEGGKDIELLKTDIHDWNITFVDTGIQSNIGQRLKAVEKHLAGEEMFLANYSDNLTDYHLPTMIEEFSNSDKVAGFLSVPPTHSFHMVSFQGEQSVSGIRPAQEAGLWINGGYFVLRQEIFDYMTEGDELVVETFQRLIEADKLMAFRHRGFWKSMETFKDKQFLDEMYDQGKANWQVWDA